MKLRTVSKKVNRQDRAFRIYQKRWSGSHRRWTIEGRERLSDERMASLSARYEKGERTT